MIMILLEKIRRLPRRLRLEFGCYIVLLAVGLSVLLPVQTTEERFLLGWFLAIIALIMVRVIVHYKNTGT